MFCKHKQRADNNDSTLILTRRTGRIHNDC